MDTEVADALDLVTDMVEELDLNLEGLVVLTEAASGHYVYTPLVAAAAGADEVIAVTRDSRYGSTTDVERRTMRLAKSLDVRDRIRVIEGRPSPEDIGLADIVTNLGFVRPIDEEFISHMKTTAAVPLMFETWEHREEDVDLQACRDRGIPVLGTNEAHPSLRVLDYVGDLCVQKLQEHGVDIDGAQVWVIAGNRFEEYIVDGLKSAGADVMKRPTRDGSEVDAVVVSSYPDPDPVFSDTSPNSARHAAGAVVLQLTGRLARKKLKEAGATMIPENPPAFGHMAWTLAELGPDPVIKLHAGGLKVGELLAWARLEGLGRKEAEDRALGHGVAQGFE